MITCTGKQTISGLICTQGKQFQDWTSDYRLFSQYKWDVDMLFNVALKNSLKHMSHQAPLVVAMDDTTIKKTGKKIPYTKYTRDPMSPPFHVNFIWAQRFLQISALIQESSEPCTASAIPITFVNIPPVPKPKFGATEEEIRVFKQRRRRENLSFHGANHLRRVRERLDNTPNQSHRQLIALVDGSFCNSNVLKNMPTKTTLIGRIRGDAKLHDKPQGQPEKGRKKLYGDKIIRPKNLMTDPTTLWQEISVFATGKLHTFKIKTETNLLWRKAGDKIALRLIVIAPLAYRLSKQGRTLYRQPAFLVCTDPDFPVEKVVQYYVWRWDVEVNFRDEKQLMGIGKAQVRNPQSVSRAPAFATAVYSLLLLASISAFGHNHADPVLPFPKWRKPQKIRRITTNQLRNTMRFDLWANSLTQSGLHFSNFKVKKTHSMKSKKYLPSCESSLFCVYN